MRRTILLVLPIIIVATFIGCSVRMKNLSVLNEETASLLAADLANKRCEKIYGTRPFLPIHYKAVFSDGKWQWGYLDLAGIHGYSAEVSFNKYGTDRKVVVSFATDVNKKLDTPKKIFEERRKY